MEARMVFLELVVPEQVYVLRLRNENANRPKDNVPPRVSHVSFEIRGNFTSK